MRNKIWMLRQLRQLRMGLSGYACSCWGVPFRGDSGLYSLDFLDRIVWIVLVSVLGSIRRNWILCAGWYEEIGLLLAGISIRSKEGSRRCSSKGREQMSGGRGHWGG